MFKSPHDYQLLLEAELPEEARAAYAADRRRSGERVYTVAPKEDWVLPDKIKEGATFRVDLYRGHFERGGVVLRADVPVTVKRVVHFRKFEPGQRSAPSSWIAFGRGKERFLAHAILGPPDVDQIAEVDGTFVEGSSVELPVTAPLADGQRAGSVTVRRVLYTEQGDLAE
jgi:hypothetical protein